MVASYRKRQREIQQQRAVPQQPTGGMTGLFSMAPGHHTAKSLWWLGCHRCEEFEEIKRLFPALEEVVMVDPLINDLVYLSASAIPLGSTISLLPFAVTSRDEYERSGGKREFLLTSNDGASSSLMPMSAECSKNFPTVHPAGSRMVDLTWLGLLGPAPDVLIMDIQGSEYDVLKGAPEVVSRIRYIYAEVSYVSLYEGQGLYQDVLDLLGPDFALVGKIDEHKTYGNALWRRR